MGKIENATQWMINLANDNSHGYDQTNRWGKDYDCSSAVITAWESNGVPVKTNGASYTGNMYSTFIACGFKDVKSSINLSTGSGLQRGDVLLNTSTHTAMYIGNGQIVHASINENGTTTGGKTGDQTGKEICIRSYYNKSWDHVLRYNEGTGGTTSNQNVKYLQILCNQLKVRDASGNSLVEDGILGPSSTYAIQHLPVLSKGCESKDPSGVRERVAIRHIQNVLNVSSDGIFGTGTYNAVVAFQRSRGLSADGIIGANTWLAFAK